VKNCSLHISYFCTIFLIKRFKTYVCITFFLISGHRTYLNIFEKSETLYTLVTLRSCGVYLIKLSHVRVTDKIIVLICYRKRKRKSTRASIFLQHKDYFRVLRIRICIYWNYNYGFEPRFVVIDTFRWSPVILITPIDKNSCSLYICSITINHVISHSNRLIRAKLS